NLGLDDMAVQQQPQAPIRRGPQEFDPQVAAEWTFYYDQLVLWQYYCARVLLRDMDQELLEPDLMTPPGSGGRVEGVSGRLPGRIPEETEAMLSQMQRQIEQGEQQPVMPLFGPGVIGPGMRVPP